MNNLTYNLPEEIRQEFSVDEQGKAFASQSAVARLCGVSQSAINQLLEKIAISKLVSEPLEPFAGNDYRGTTKIPDFVVAAIINHYAMFARNTTSGAKKISLCFQAIGIRTWIQQELGWEKPQQPTANERKARLMPHELAEDVAVKIASIQDTLADNPRLAQILTDHAINTILESPSLPGSTEPRLRGVVEIAHEMGYRTNHSSRVRLGAFVKDLVGNLAKKEIRLCNGVNTEINCYPDVSEVRLAIATFFEV